MRERVAAARRRQRRRACGSRPSTRPACASCAARPSSSASRKIFTIYDSGDSRALIKRIIKELDADTFGFTPAARMGKISKLKNELRGCRVLRAQRELRATRPSACSSRSSASTQRALQRANAFDFDDLIGADRLPVPRVPAGRRALPAALPAHPRRRVPGHQPRPVRAHPRADAADRLGREADRGVRRHDDLRTRSPSPADAASLTVVGDSDQSIYAFRGADIRNIVEFERDFPGAKVVLLEQNYRSTQNILTRPTPSSPTTSTAKTRSCGPTVGAGEKIVGFTGYSQHDEAQFIADEIETLHEAGVDYTQMSRCSTAPTRRPVRWRRSSSARRCPYRIMGGTKFYERAEIKDALAYLIAVANPADELALRRIMNTPEARHRRRPPRRHCSATPTDSGITLPRCAARTRRRSASGPKVTGAIAQLGAVLDEVDRRHAARAGELAPPTAVADVLTAAARARPATSTRCARAATRRTRRAPRTSRSSSPSRKEFAAQQPRRHAHRLPHRGLAGRGCRRPRRRVAARSRS